MYPSFFEDYPKAAERMREEHPRDHVYDGYLEEGEGVEEGRHVLFTYDRRSTEIGGVLGLSYGLTYQSVTLSLGVSARLYTSQYKIYGVGASLSTEL